MPSTEAMKQKICAGCEKSANTVNWFIRLLPIIMGVIVMIVSLSISLVHITISYVGVIVGSYMIAGGFIFCLIEKQNQSLFEILPGLETKFGQGVFYIFVGTLPFTATGINDVLGVFLFLTGLVIISRGAYVIFKDRRAQVKTIVSEYYPVDLVLVDENETKIEPEESPEDLESSAPLDV